MSNEERRKQMVTEAKAYTAKFYDNGSADSKIKMKTEETFTDFCAGWMAADKSRWIPVKERLQKQLAKQDSLAQDIRDWIVNKCDTYPDYYDNNIIAAALGQVAKEYGYEEE